MKMQSFAGRASALACGLVAVLAAACGDDTAGETIGNYLDAGGSTADATTDGAAPVVDAGVDSAAQADSSVGPDATADSGSVPEAGTDAAADGAVEASAGDASPASDAGDAGNPDAGDAGNPDAGDAGNPDSGDAGNSGGGVACTGTPSANLIVNGDAESGTGSTNAAPVATPGWTSTGEATALVYGSGGYPALTDPGPADRGVNLFIGGYNDATSSLTQTIDLTADAASIDAAGVTYALSGWLGGYSTQEDYATLTVTFQDGTLNALGTGTIGPVTAEDRADATGLLLRGTTGSVPVGTRSALVVLAMVREAGTANDGYADNLSLTLCGLP